MKHIIKNRTDFITGLVMIGFCILVMSQMSELPFETILFPRAVMVIGILIGAAVVLKSLIKPGGKGQNSKLSTVSVAEAGIIIWILLLLLLATTIGLFTATYLVVTTISLYISYCREGFRAKQMLFSAGYSAIIVAVLYVLFKVILGIRTPNGIFI